MSAVVWAVWACLGAGFVLGFVRLVRGPSLADRVVGLDLMGMLAVGLMAVEAVYTGEEVFLAAALVLSLVLFLGTAAFSVYIWRETGR